MTSLNITITDDSVCSSCQSEENDLVIQYDTIICEDCRADFF